MQNICFNTLIINMLAIFHLFYRLTDKYLIINKLLLLHRQVSGDYQRLAYIINDYQGVHFERLSF